MNNSYENIWKSGGKSRRMDGEIRRLTSNHNKTIDDHGDSSDREQGAAPAPWPVYDRSRPHGRPTSGLPATSLRWPAREESGFRTH